MTEAKMAKETTNVFEIYIQATQDKVWQALSDPDIMAKYFFGSRVESNGKPGSTYYFVSADGTRIPTGKVVEIDPPRRMVSTFKPETHNGEPTDIAESLLTWEITPMGNACKLTLIHDKLDATHPLAKEFGQGWTMFLSAIKTYLETGEPLKLG
jgi:uncharacterized protein YndB with AHSA1/START domain